MPASIPITTNEKKWLKKIVEEKFEIVISDSYSSKLLSELLLKNFGLKINYNTIRRIFEVVKSNNSPSIFSLNLLSKSINFKDFEDFKKYVYKFDKDIFNELVHLSYESKKINHESLMEFVKDLTLPNWEQIYQLKNVVDLCIQIQDFNFLKQVIHLKFSKENEDFLEKFAVCFQSLYFETKNKNLSVNKFILQNIPTSEILQRILLQVYVSEDYLNDFWGDWLEAATVELVSDMVVFKSILLCQKNYNNNLFEEANILHTKAKNAVLNIDLNIHPILLGRIAAWETILYSNDQDSPLYFKAISNSFEKVCYSIFYYRLTQTYNKNTFQEGIVESIDLSKIQNKLSAFDKKLLNKFYLISALYYHHNTAFEKAKIALLNVDERSLDVWELGWFYKNFKMLKEIYN